MIGRDIKLRLRVNMLRYRFSKYFVSGWLTFSCGLSRVWLTFLVTHRLGGRDLNCFHGLAR